MKPTLLLILIAFIVSGCQYDPYADQLTTVKPQIKDVAGVYHFKYHTLNNKLKKEDFKKASIILNTDSTYTMTEVPDFTGVVSDFKYKGAISTKGKWHFEIIGSIANGKDKPSDMWGIILTGVPTNLQSIGFTGKKAPYGLLITYGDPDAATVMAFDKR